MTNPKYTTAEYLAWIDNKLATLTEIENTTLVMPMEVIARASLLANRDVLERHKPIPYNDGSTFCRACNGVPCPTYLDIAQRLDEVM